MQVSDSESIASTDYFQLPKEDTFEEDQVELFKGQVILNPTISKKNFYAFLLFGGYIGIIFLPLNLLQTPLLRQNYHLTDEERANVTYIANIFQLVFKVMLAPICASMCDKFGRRAMITFGVLCLTLSAFLFPFVPEIYPYYIMVLFLMDMGLSSVMCAPLLADYSDYETKGRVAGILTVIGYIASSVSTFASGQMDLKSDLSPKFFAIGGLALVLGLGVASGLKGGLYHKNLMYDKKAEKAKRRITKTLQIENSLSEDVVESLEPIPYEKHVKPGLMAGLREAKNPWILTGYICDFISMQGNALFGYILITFVTKMTGEDKDESQAISLNNKHMIVGFLTAAFIGFYADKYNKFKIVMFILLSSMVGVLLLVITPSPFHVIAYISMVFLGISSAGFRTIISQLLGKYASPKYRASVVGVGHIFSIVGASTSNILGVYLSKKDPYVPFFMNLGCSVIGLFVLTWLYMSKKNILNRL